MLHLSVQRFCHGAFDLRARIEQPQRQLPRACKRYPVAARDRQTDELLRLMCVRNMQ
jgi:hypothetical protein